MSFDPKIGTKPLVYPVPLARTEIETETAGVSRREVGFSASSQFENRRGLKSAEGRMFRGGVADDTIGRGVADDTIGRGVADDTIGRGVADDTIGRGVADDTIGRGVADDTIGRGVGDYQVRAGDTLWGIAKTLAEQLGAATDTTVANMLQELKQANPQLTTAARKGGNVLRVKDPVYFPQSFTALQNDVNSLFERVRGTSVGPDTDPNRLALRDAIFAKLEAPSWAESGPAAKQRIEAALSPLEPTAREQLTSLMSGLDDEGLKLLGAAAEKSPRIFAQTDSTGSTLLANLSLMASQPLNDKISGHATTSELLTSTLRDIVNPCRIAQGEAPTCTVTSMQFELVTDDPAEYVRLLAGLTGQQGKVAMRGGGELMLGADDAKARNGRGISQAIFQSSCMEFANGAMRFNPVAQQSTHPLTGTARRGLTPDQQTTMLRSLFGVTYHAEILYDEAQGARALETLRGFDSRKHRNRPVIIELDQGPINHAVTLERVANGSVDFRDPYGVLRSITEAQFPKYVVAIHRPQ